MKFQVIVRPAGVDFRKITIMAIPGDKLDTYQEVIVFPAEASDSFINVLRRGSGAGGHVEIQTID